MRDVRDLTGALVSVLGASVGTAFGLDVAWIAVLATGLLAVTASIIPSVRAAWTDVLRAIQSP